MPTNRQLKHMASDGACPSMQPFVHVRKSKNFTINALLSSVFFFFFFAGRLRDQIVKYPLTFDL